jgi:hypothetical protein
MPKRIFKVDQFHGGLNSNSSARDVDRAEFVDGIDAAVDTVGQLGVMNSEIDSGITTHLVTGQSPGYGFFSYKTDRSHAGVETPTKWLAKADASDYDIDIYHDDGTNTGWETKQLDMGASVSSSKLKAHYYLVDGALRVADADWNGNTQVGWYGFINRTLFSKSTTPIALGGSSGDWFNYKSEPARPVNAEFSANEYLALLTGGTYVHADGIATTSSSTTATITANANSQILAAGGWNLPADTMCNKIKIQIAIYTDSTQVDANQTTISTQVDSHAYKYSLQIKNYDDSGNVIGANTKTINQTGTANVGSHREEINVDFPYNIEYDSSGTDSKVTVQLTWDGDTGDGIQSITIPGYGVEFERRSGTSGENGWASHSNLNGSGETTANSDHGANSVHVGFRFYNDGDTSTGTAAPDGSEGAYGWDKTWKTGVSFLYDDFGPTQQESLIKECQGNVKQTQYTFRETEEDIAPYLAVFIKYAKSDGSSNWNKRVTGCRIYIKQEDSKEWHPQATCNFVEGYIESSSTGQKRPVLFDNITSGTSTYPQYVFMLERADLLTPHKIDTFRSMSGYDHDQEAISPKFKTSVVNGRSVYIGNLQFETKDGTETMGDTMVKCVPNKFDTFPMKNKIDVAIRDGESIVALEEYADRILQFKEDTLYIINASRDSEFLEDVYKYRGIPHPSCVCNTDYGIAWTNRFGCFLYDGKQVVDLLELKGLRKVKQSTWDTFMTKNSGAAIPSIAYVPKKKQIVVVDDTDNSDENYLYNFITDGWTRGTSRFAYSGSGDMSNFVVNPDGDVLFSRTLYNQKFGVPASSGDFTFLTRDIDFGEPGITKKISKVIVTYKTGSDSSDSNINVLYKVNGKSDFSSSPGTFVATNAGGRQSGESSNYVGSTLDASLGWTVAELVPTSTVGSVFSIQMRFKQSGSDVPSGFAINDISVIYRPKPITNAIVVEISTGDA